MLATKLLLENTAPHIDPLGPENLLIFASSIIAGHNAPGLSRFTVAAKSPLTSGIGETRAEGPFGQALKKSGAEAIIFRGVSPSPVTVLIEDGEVRFLDATHLWGANTLATTEALEAELGAGSHVATIGPAGENRVRFASIVTHASFQAARMGMGAVMGSKNLKALVLRGGKLPQVACESTLDSLSRTFAGRIPLNALSSWQKQPPGFSCWIHLHGVEAALCVNNYSKSAIKGTEHFSAEEFLKRVSEAAPCAACPNDCIRLIQAGNAPLERSSAMHQEAVGTLGPNLGITSLDWVLGANSLCNQLGLDPVSLGYTLSFAMELAEKGILEGRYPEFGNQEHAAELIHAISARQGLGDILADGSRLAADRIGGGAERFAMHVKGLEIVCFEPRTQTGLALGYATAPIGPRYDIAEHDWDFDTASGWEHSLHLARTLGIHDRIPMNALNDEKVRRFKVLNTLWSALDALDICVFAAAPTRILSMPEMAAMVGAITGWQTSDYELMRWGERRNQIMRLYNAREGFTAGDDTLPARFFDEPIAEGPRTGDVLDRTTFQHAIQTYYALMGWDERGVLTHSTMLEHGLL